MPAIPKRLHFGVLLILLLVGAVMTGGQSAAARSVRSDSVDKDNKYSLYGPQRSTEQKEDARPRTRSGTVGSVTPNLTGRVAEKKSENPDTIGWLYIPGTSINQVVVSNPSQYEDNNYYLTRNFYGEANRDGAFCADYRIDFGTGKRQELPRNTSIYGHSWTDDPGGSLFSQLKKYRDADFAREHPYLYFSTESESMAWQVFAVFETVTDLNYISPTLSSTSFSELMDLVDRASLYRYDFGVSSEDKIITLSTCTYSVQGHEALPAINNYRFVVMAKLVERDAVRVKEAEFYVNPSPAAPDQVYRYLDASDYRSYAHGSSLL